MQEKDLYKILNVDKKASQDEIKKSYRELSKKYHPDVNPDNKEAEEKFKDISAAYRVLSDPKKKAQYNDPMSGFDLSSFFDGFNPFFGGHMVRPRRPDPNAPRRGGVIELEVPVPFHKLILREEVKLYISFIDVCVGCNGTGAEESEFCEECQGIGTIMKTESGHGVFIQSSVTCSQCRGRGSKIIKTCDKCEGRGRVEVRDKEIKLKLNEMMRDRYQIRIQGKGGRGLNGGPDGDLIAILNIVHPRKEDLTEEQIDMLRGLNEHNTSVKKSEG